MLILTFPMDFGHKLLIVVVLLLVCVIVARCNSFGSEDSLLVSEPSTKANANELIVIVHGALRSVDDMEPIKSLVESVRPDAEVLRFGFPSQLFSNADLFSLADQLEKQIDELYELNQYERIVLSGHSLGALLVRKAYVYGCGRIEDGPGTDGKTLPKRDAKAWVSKVDRFVLMAGVNRGWSREAKQESGEGKEESAPAYKRILLWLWYRIAKLSNTGRLVLSAEKGKPFVANLRIQWLEVMSKTDKEQRPQVIQLLGTNDDIVHPDDSKDVKVAKHFIWVSVPSATHSSIINVGDSDSGRVRRKFIAEAFRGDAVERLRPDGHEIKAQEDLTVKSVVFVLHGIRDMAKWPIDYKEPLEAAYRDTYPNSPFRMEVVIALYGYFGMGPFLFWADRQKNVKWFMDQITELKAQYPKLEEISIIGHSNGTYILASALKNYASLVIHRSVLAGSVIRRDFPWSDYANRIQRVRNYVGAGDWVVGLCSCVFEKPLFNMFNRDIGSAGFNGFEDKMVVPDQTKYLKGEHGAALDEKNLDSIVAFIINGDRVDAPQLTVDDHPVWFGFVPLSLLSQLCWLLWLLAIALLLWGMIKSPDVLLWLMHHFAPGVELGRNTVTWLSRGGYLLIVWMILCTI
jgi:predicted esterase